MDFLFGTQKGRGKYIRDCTVNGSVGIGPAISTHIIPLPLPCLTVDVTDCGAILLTNIQFWFLVHQSSTPSYSFLLSSGGGSCSRQAWLFSDLTPQSSKLNTDWKTCWLFGPVSHP